MVDSQERIVTINEGICVHEVRSCLLCGTEGMFIYQSLRDRLFGAPGTWALMRCPKCDLVWLNPRPVPADVGKLYEQYFTHDINRCYVPKFAGLRRTIRDATLASCLGYSDLARGLLQKGLGRVLSWFRPIRERVELGVMALYGQRRGRLLDVGCGSGLFLSRMRDLGWEVMGVEPDPKAVSVACNQFGIDVYQGTLEEARFPEESFDAITMSHLIEHIWDPINTLQECRRLLKPNGKLVVVTPNIKSLCYRLFKESWRELDPPRHFYLFSSHTLRACVERAGLQVIKVETAARSAREIGAASWLIQRNGALPGGSPKKLGLRLQLEGLVFEAVEYGWCWVKDVGEEIMLIATK